MTPRICPACRLPRLPDQVHVGEDAGVFLVFAICRHCAARFNKLPTAPRHKLLNATLQRAGTNPGRYWAAPFGDKGAMRLAAGLLAHPLHSIDAVRAIGWL